MLWFPDSMPPPDVAEADVPAPEDPLEGLTDPKERKLAGLLRLWFGLESQTAKPQSGGQRGRAGWRGLRRDSGRVRSCGRPHSELADPESRRFGRGDVRQPRA